MGRSGLRPYIFFGATCARADETVVRVKAEVLRFAQDDNALSSLIVVRSSQGKNAGRMPFESLARSSG
jgi:hypothetical protein